MPHMLPGYGDLSVTQDELSFTPTAVAAIITGANLVDTPLTIGFGLGVNVLLDLAPIPSVARRAGKSLA